MTKIKAMTEPEWLTGCDYHRMLKHAQQHLRVSRTPGGARRLRLLAVACCRHVWPLLTDPRSRAAVEAAERYADGKARRAELEEAAAAANEVEREARQRSNQLDRSRASQEEQMAIDQAWHLAGMPVRTTYTLLLADWVRFLLGDLGRVPTAPRDGDPEAVSAARQQGAAIAADLVRDVFGNPFRPAPVVADAWLAWQGGTIARMARAIYEERAFDRLPVLADALEEAGCAEAEILDHCRRSGPHARGCWLLDALLAAG
jgi:hypothetical protein